MPLLLGYDARVPVPLGPLLVSPGTDRSLERDLAAAVDGEVRFDAGTRATYSCDSSNYRQVPLGVVLPHTVAAAEQAVEGGVAGARTAKRGFTARHTLPPVDQLVHEAARPVDGIT